MNGGAKHANTNDVWYRRENTLGLYVLLYKIWREEANNVGVADLAKTIACGSL